MIMTTVIFQIQLQMSKNELHEATPSNSEVLKLMQFGSMASHVTKSVLDPASSMHTWKLISAHSFHCGATGLNWMNIQIEGHILCVRSLLKAVWVD